MSNQELRHHGKGSGIHLLLDNSYRSFHTVVGPGLLKSDFVSIPQIKRTLPEGCSSRSLQASTKPFNTKSGRHVVIGYLDLDFTKRVPSDREALLPPCKATVQLRTFQASSQVWR